MRVRAKAWALAAAITAAAMPLLAGASEHWEIAIGCGSWSLSPFTPLLEKEAAGMAEKEVARRVTPYLPSWVGLQQDFSIHIGSSGFVGSLSLWYRFGRSRFSLGAEAGMVRLRLPLEVDLRQSATILGVTVASADTQGTGQLEVEAVACSLLARWEAVKARRFSLSLEAGCCLLPFSGSLSLDLTTEVKSVLGDETYQTREERSLFQLREEFPETPALIVAPILRVSARYRLLHRGGIMIDGAFFHGSMLQAGLFYLL